MPWECRLQVSKGIIWSRLKRCIGQDQEERTDIKGRREHEKGVGIECGNMFTELVCLGQRVCKMEMWEIKLDDPLELNLAMASLVG